MPSIFYANPLAPDRFALDKSAHARRIILPARRPCPIMALCLIILLVRHGPSFPQAGLAFWWADHSLTGELSSTRFPVVMVLRSKTNFSLGASLRGNRMSM